MGDFNNPNENNNVQENNLNNGQPNNLNVGQPNNLNNDQQQNQQPQYDQNQNQQGNPYQQPQYNQPQYQQPQYGGQSGYQQNNGQYQQNNGQYQQNPYQQYSQYPQPQKKDNAMAIAALICGIVGVVLGCCAWYITLPVSIVGLVLGILCLNKKKDGRTMAIIGIVLCAFGILIGILGIIGTVAILNGGESYLNDFYGDFNWEEYY